ncbi:MAG: phospholipase D-like domain-containing protein [Candidatus Saliniplasma sp.]
MNKLAVVILVLLFLLPQPVAGESEPDIKIDEVYYKSQPGCEYFVLSNWGGEGIINELRISDFEGNLTIYDLYFEEGEKLVIAADETDYNEIGYSSPDLIMYEDFDTDGNFKLANEDDELLIYTDRELSDAFYYGEGDGSKGWTGERCKTVSYASYVKRREQDTNSAEDWNWSRDWKVGHSDFDSEKISYEGNTTAFVSPDNSHGVMMDFLEDVEESLKISIYELRNRKITNRISDLAKNGVEVKILAEGDPVGGLSEEVNMCLGEIKESGGEVHLIGRYGYSPYRFLHSKLMIADDERVLVSSENFGYTGYPLNPTYGNRGWGVVLENSKVAEYYSQMFYSDFKYGYELVGGDNEEFEEESTDHWAGFHSRNFEPQEVNGAVEVEPVISPDTSKKGIIDMINSAEESIYVQQFYIRQWGYEENPFISNIIKRAKEGVEVKILLDSTWYNLGDYTNGTGNDDYVEELRDISRNKGVDLEAKLISDEHGLSKVHNKGMIVDETKVLVSSINWNSNSVLQNREVGVIIDNNDIGEYFSDIFLSDWRDDTTAPIADAGRDLETTVGRVVELRGDNSWDDRNIEVYKWDINNDGNYEGREASYSTIFREPGSYQAKLYVEDEYGNWDTDTVNIIVNEEEAWMDKKENTTGLPLTPIIVLVAISAAAGLWKYRNINRS